MSLLDSMKLANLSNHEINKSAMRLINVGQDWDKEMYAMALAVNLKLLERQGVNLNTLLTYAGNFVKINPYWRREIDAVSATFKNDM